MTPLLDHLDKLSAEGTPGPWQTRFIYRLFRFARKNPATPIKITLETHASADMPDSELIVALRNNYPLLSEAIRKADALVKSLAENFYPSHETMEALDSYREARGRLGK